MMIKRLKRSKLRSALLLGFSTGIILLSGCLTMLLHVQQHQITHADGGNIVGAPSLSAATIDAIFTRAGSPMAGTGKIVEQAARQANVDDAFAMGVWWAETNDGMAGVGRGDRNPGAVRASPGYPAGLGGYTLYPSYAAAIVDWFTILRSRYVDRGLTSVYTICYPYVGTAGSASWAAKVMTYMVRYRGEAPPTPAVAPPHQIPSHKPFSMGADGRQKTIGFVQGESKLTSGIPVANRTAQQSLVPIRPLADQLPPVMLGLLAALAIAFYAYKIRSAPVAFEPVVDMSSATPISRPLYVNQYSPVLAPVYINQYSPVIERETTTLFESQWLQQPFGVEQQAFAAFAGEASAPSLPTTPLPAVHEAFVSQNKVEVRPHRVRLQRTSEAALLASEPSVADGYNPYTSTARTGVTIDNAHFLPSTQALQHPLTPVPQADQVPAYVRSGGGGLLSRYRLEQANQHQ
jgi:hypothetical protein